MRQKFELDHREMLQFDRLRPFAGDAFAFWHSVAKRRDLDPATVISKAPAFTALPKDSGKQWCFPIALKCVKMPVYRE